MEQQSSKRQISGVQIKWDNNFIMLFFMDKKWPLEQL